MNRFNCSSARERTADSLIELAHCSQRDRIIVAEPKAPEIMFELNRRGYIRVATTAMCALPRGQYDCAIVD
jgi:hypothetical protein